MCAYLWGRCNQWWGWLQLSLRLNYLRAAITRRWNITHYIALHYMYITILFTSRTAAVWHMLYHFRHLSLQDGWSPVHVAARNGHLHIVRELVEKLNADVLATKPVCLWFTLHVKVPIKLCTKLLPLFVCTGLAECPASSCVWRSFWGSEVPSAHLRTLQVWLWQPSSDLPTQGSQRRALEDPEVPHWRTRIWSKPYRPGIHSVHVHFYTFSCQQCVSCEFYLGKVMILPCYLTVLHNVSSLLRTIEVIGLEYPTHCCTHSPNVCRMTWTASCWLVPMGGWGLCRSWWQGTMWTNTRRMRYFCMYNRMCWHLSCNIQPQLSCGSECHVLQFFTTCESLQRIQLFAIIIHEYSPSQWGLPSTFASLPSYYDKYNKGVYVQNM